MVICGQNEIVETAVRSRLNWIDSLRTTAIVIMVFANSAAYFFTENVNVNFRIVSSLAAPLFIFLAGVNLSFSDKGSRRKLLLRGFYLFITAAMIDVTAWKIFPFGTFDVLYLIAIGIISCACLRFGWIADLIIGFGLVISSFFIGGIYRFDIIEVPINESISFNYNFLTSTVARALFDGWFPVLPWLGYVFIGRAVMSKIQYLKGLSVFVLILIAFVSGFCVLTFSTLNDVRAYYVEVFYPVTGTYVLTSFSFILLLTMLFKNSDEVESSLKKEVTSIGRNSLLMYILHCFMISLFADVFPIRNTGGFIFFCFFQLILMYLIAKLLSLQKVSLFRSKLPYPLAAIFGLK